MCRSMGDPAVARGAWGAAVHHRGEAEGGVNSAFRAWVLGTNGCWEASGEGTSVWGR